MSDDAGLVVRRPKRSGRRLEVYPTKYTEKLGLEIVTALAESNVGFEHVWRKHRDWPHWTTVFKWRKKYPDFDRLFAEAESMRAARLIYETVQIADDDSRDLITDEKGRQFPNSAAPTRDKLRVEARFSAAKRLDPHRWGDKLDVNAQLGFRSLDDNLPFLK